MNILFSGDARPGQIVHLIPLGRLLLRKTSEERSIFLGVHILSCKKEKTIRSANFLVKL